MRDHAVYLPDRGRYVTVSEMTADELGKTLDDIADGDITPQSDDTLEALRARIEIERIARALDGVS